MGKTTIKDRPNLNWAVRVSGPSNEDVSDYRNVPRSDRGNEDYTDRGMLGSYTPTDEPYKAPDDVRYFTGYGATRADLDRGYIEPDIREAPNYDKDNYKYRSTDPSVASVDFNNPDSMMDDWEFRNRNRRARGFLTRPTNSRER